MTQQVGSISPLGSHPYITIDEYKQAPTSVDVDDFVGGGSMALNDVELGNVLARASSWMDAHCGQVLSATVDTENFRGRASRDGFLRVHPRYWPIASLVSASFGSSPQSMQSLSADTAWIESESIVFPLALSNMSFLGPIQFSKNYQVLAEQFITITYINGYANTLLSASANSGVTSLPVQELAGFVPNTKFTVFDGVNTEILTVASSFTATTGAGSVTLAAPTAYAHANGMSASALPPAVKQACIYMTNVILKSRGNSALVMDSITATSIVGNNPNVSNDYNMACDLLKPFRRIR